MAFGKLRSVLSRSRSSSPSPQTQQAEFVAPPLTPLHLHGYRSGTKHRLLTEEIAEELRQHMPSILQIGHEWQLQYSLEQNGASLNTLYACTQAKPGENVTRRRGFLLVVEDSHRGVFGAYINDHLRPLDKKYYYGNGDCFLFKVEHAKVKQLSRDDTVDKTGDQEGSKDSQQTAAEMLRIKVFPYTGVNNFIIYSNSNYISVGSGDGKFGLWIDASLETGASDSVDTFGNEPLSRSSKFHIVGVEVWKV